MYRVKNNLNNLKPLEGRRKALRKNLTSAEAALWLYLKNRQPDGRRFRRQFSVGNYVLDFYCPSENLNVELDGANHFTEEGLHADLERDAFLKRYGITVLRFENQAFWNNPKSVLTEIKKNFKSQQKNSSFNSPPSRGSVRQRRTRGLK